METKSTDFVAKPSLPPPVSQTSYVVWVKENLFSNWLNTLLTLAVVYLIYTVVPPFIEWALIDANWTGTDRSVCDSNRVGACWTFINVRLIQILFGLFYSANPDEIWRPIAVFFMLIMALTPLFINRFPYKSFLVGFIILIFPFIGYGLIHGEWFDLEVAETSSWGGFMLTFILASIGILGAFPLGVLLALGRRSEMPIVRTFCVVFIEFWRGTPLITILFMASVMLPLFFPADVDFDKVARALIGITLFQSAYTAEAVRAGLQAIPKGQHEAGASLGLGYWQSMVFIILPQALKVSIPGIVNTFIELFKDTSLVAIIGLLDLLNIAQSASRSIQWQGFDLEAYVFVAIIYWVCCYSLSQFSQYLERQTEHGHGRSA